MKTLIFSVYDKAVGAFLPPFYVRSRGEALRSFSEACNDGKHNFNRHAADYSLMFLGYFDDTSGMFSTADPTRIVGAYECVADDPFTVDAQVASEDTTLTKGH